VVVRPGIEYNETGGEKIDTVVKSRNNPKKERNRKPGSGITYLLPRVLSSRETARFIAPKDASQAKSKVSQVSVSHTPREQRSFQNADNWVVYCSKWGIDDFVC